MNTKIFNACLLAGWFLLTLGGVLYRPEFGLMIGGLALIMLTLAIALRIGLYDQAPQAPSKNDKTSAA